MGYKEQVLEQVEVAEKISEEHEIIVHNDEFNTFDHVIETLIEYCDHTPTQAEQCTILIHYKGKCGVKTGELEDLKNRCSKILEAGISAEVI
jgi:ATP-dependent Clp protease adaptor protein ClpS